MRDPEKIRAKQRRYYARNRKERLEHTRNYRRNLPKGVLQLQRLRQRLRLFGITVEQYNEMFTAQNGLCAICKCSQDHQRLSIDHDHSCCPGYKSCGKCLRGLLCSRCNFLLGYFESSLSLIPQCEAYLAAHKRL